MPIIAREIPVFDHLKFLSRIKIDKETECWEWKSSLMSTGYGSFSINDKNYLAHRMSYSLFHGEIEKGLVIDHICRNRSCVNPMHLRQVTMRTNALENSLSISSTNHKKNVCKNGHSLSDENLCNYPSDKHRRCRVCVNNRSKIYSKKQKNVDARKAYALKNKEKIKIKDRERSARKRAQKCL